MPNNLTTLVLGVLGLFFLPVLPPVGILMLLIAAGNQMRIATQARNIQAMYDAVQAQKDRRARILAYKSLS